MRYDCLNLVILTYCKDFQKKVYILPNKCLGENFFEIKSKKECVDKIFLFICIIGMYFSCSNKWPAHQPRIPQPKQQPRAPRQLNQQPSQQLRLHVKTLWKPKNVRGKRKRENATRKELLKNVKRLVKNVKKCGLIFHFCFLLRFPCCTICIRYLKKLQGRL